MLHQHSHPGSGGLTIPELLQSRGMWHRGMRALGMGWGRWPQLSALLILPQAKSPCGVCIPSAAPAAHYMLGHRVGAAPTQHQAAELLRAADRAHPQHYSSIRGSLFKQLKTKELPAVLPCCVSAASTSFLSTQPSINQEGWKHPVSALQNRAPVIYWRIPPAPVLLSCWSRGQQRQMHAFTLSRICCCQSGPARSLRSSRMCSCSQPHALIDFREPIHQFNLVDHPPGLLFTVKGNSIKTPGV